MGAHPAVSPARDADLSVLRALAPLSQAIGWPAEKPQCLAIRLRLSPDLSIRSNISGPATLALPKVT